jgi:hypothetical protein
LGEADRIEAAVSCLLPEQFEGVVPASRADSVHHPQNAHGLEHAGARQTADVDGRPAERGAYPGNRRFASASSPQMNMSGGPPGKSGSTMWALPTMLNAFTTRAPGSQRCTCSPPDQCRGRGGGSSFGAKSRGFVTSMTTFPTQARIGEPDGVLRSGPQRREDDERSNSGGVAETAGGCRRAVFEAQAVPYRSVRAAAQPNLVAAR